MEVAEVARPGSLEHVRVGIALPGGGARGLAEIGVLRVLQREGIPIDLVAGTSIGSIIGGLFACYADADRVQRDVLDMLHSAQIAGLDLQRILRLRGVAAVDGDTPGATASGPGMLERVQRTFRRLYASHVALSRMSVLNGDKVERILNRLFGERTFDDVMIPFAAVAVDLTDACPVIVANGKLALGIAASSAIAGIFPPVQIDGHMLIDGGYTSPVPIDAAMALGANVVVAVDVSLDGVDLGRLDNGVEVALRSSEISLLALEREQLRRADIVIPARGKARHWADYSDPMEAIAAGERAAGSMIDAVRAVIQERARRFL